MQDAQRYRTVLSLGLPIMGGMLSQSLLNLVDAALVGRLGEDALAAVGAASYANFVVISLILGLSSSVQTLVARFSGQQSPQNALQAVSASLVLATIISLPLTLFFTTFSETLLLPLLAGDSSNSQRIANDYFDYRVAALCFVAANLAFRGWWNGTQRPITYLRSLIVTQVINVPLSYGLIFGHWGLPELGASGAGLGTALSLLLGTVLNTIVIGRDIRTRAFEIRAPQVEMIHTIFRLALPHSMQQLFMALSVMVLFSIVGLLGSEQQAITHVLINLTLLLILPAVGIGIATTSLVSHALGANQPPQAYRWGWIASKAAFIMIFVISLPMWIWPESLLKLFLTNEALITQAVTPLRLSAAAICIDVIAIVLAQALLGVGATKQVFTISTSVQWLVFLPLAWLTGPIWGLGLVGIWCSQVIYRTISSLVFIHVWRKRSWIANSRINSH